jgi:hypothetical protein
MLTDDDPVSALAELIPSPVDHVLLQADLTAVAPGPLEPLLARKLQLVADVESRGGATVYRFTTDSVRRAFDAGWSSVELHDFVAEVSRTSVPQPLTYLIDDTARRFGSIRIGAVESFLRADDEAVLTELMHHPQAASLGLRQIAPTVLLSDAPVDVLLTRLRELGSAPVLEAADGSVQIARQDLRRARTPRPGRVASMATARDTAQLMQSLRAIRAGDQIAATRPVVTERLSPADSLAALRSAIEAAQSVWMSYVDHHGTTSERVIDPIRIESGALIAHDQRSGETRSFTVHRIISVRAIDDPADNPA